MSENRIIKAINKRRPALQRFTKRCTPVVHTLSSILSISTLIASLIAVVCMIILVGFNLSPANAIMLGEVISICGIIFACEVVFNIVFNWKETRRNTRPVKWVFDLIVLVTLLPVLFPNTGIAWIENILFSRAVLFPIIGIYAIWELCFSITRMFGRKTNPSLLLATSFLFFIVIGSFLLMMPKCTITEIGYVDSLFVSTSAVCVTGLAPFDISQVFTPLGLLIIAILIQIGGLGVITFTSFFALFFSGNTTIYSQLMVKDMVQSKTINALLPTLLYILCFTLIIELIGAVMIFLSIHGTMGMSLQDEIIFSGFHSLSAFCNAGFSNLEGGLSNPQLLYHNQSIYLIISAIIFLGSIGFPILVNFKTAISINLRRLWNKITRSGRHIKLKHIYDFNTKLVLTVTLTIYVVSAILFLLFEYNNSLAGLSFSDKIVQSVFNVVVPRTAGLASINPISFMPMTIIMIIILMWIGGSSQSTAGGIKVNTLGVILLELKSVIYGRSRVVAYNRTIANDSLRRASAVVVLSIIVYFLYTFILLALEPTMSVKAIFFEIASALYTVGSTLGITSELSDISKIVVASAMFVGRVGMLSLLIGFIGHKNDTPIKYPTDNIIIN